MKQWALGKIRQLTQSFLGAVTFYTLIPLPSHCLPDYERIARWAPLIGVVLGCFLGLLDRFFEGLGMPILTRSAIAVVFGLWVTGGLHLDGAIDTADGLAVGDPKRRLEVMKESTTGAFGAIAAAVILILKIVALSDLGSDRGFFLAAAAGWGRWGQVLAIACYPYLREQGIGGFHKQGIRLPQDVLLGLLILITWCGGVGAWLWQQMQMPLIIIGVGGAIAWVSGWWLNRRFGGHTGDTYGAIVEWTEALFLCCCTMLIR